MKRNKCTMCNQPDSRNDTRQLSEPNEPGALRRQQVFTTFYSFCCSLHGNSKGRQLWGMTDRAKSNLCTIMHILAFSTSFIILFITFYYQKILPLRKSIVTPPPTMCSSCSILTSFLYVPLRWMQFLNFRIAWQLYLLLMKYAVMQWWAPPKVMKGD